MDGVHDALMLLRSGARLRRTGRSIAALLMLACVSDGPNGPSQPPGPIATPSELGALVGALAHDSLRGRRAGSLGPAAAFSF